MLIKLKNFKNSNLDSSVHIHAVGCCRPTTQYRDLRKTEKWAGMSVHLTEIETASDLLHLPAVNVLQDTRFLLSEPVWPNGKALGW